MFGLKDVMEQLAQHTNGLKAVVVVVGGEDGGCDVDGGSGSSK